MPKSRIDFSAVNNAALAHLDDLIRQVDPDARLVGDEWEFLDPQRPSRNRGDSRINRTTGKWSDFASDAKGGDVVSWWAHCHNLGQADAARDLASRFGVNSPESISTKKAKSSKYGEAIFPIPSDAPEPDWRALANPSRWAYRDAEGHLLRYHLRWDGPDGKRYAPLTWRCPPGGRPAWFTEGLPDPQPLYGLDRLAQRPTAPVIVCEGEKVADAAATIFPELVAVCSANGSKNARKADWGPLEGRDVTIWPDADEPGRSYADAACRQLATAGAGSIAVVQLPEGLPKGWDLADEPPAGINLPDLLKSAKPYAAPPQESTPSDLPEILVCPPEHKVADAARAALAATGTIFQRGGQLVGIQRAGKAQGARIVPPGTAEIVACSPAYIRERASASARFVKWDEKDKELKPCSVPQYLAFMLVDGMEHPDFPVLVATVETPVLLPDGRVLANAGMDAESGIYLDPLRDFPPVPDRPTRDDARAARDRLFEVLQDFEFATSPSREAHQAAALGFLLTVTGRYAIPGPVPLVVVDASVAGAGKGLLVTVQSIIATGRPAAVMTAPRSGEEFQKGMLPVLQSGTRLQLLDEAHHFGGGAEMNAAITAGVARARILGTSRTLTVPNLTVWAMAGNNLSLQDETPRRSLPIRLEPTVERPEDRDGWAFPDLVGHVQAHQPELLRDALTILRAFHVAGRPASGLKPWGSFEAWSRLVRDAVYWVTDGVDLDCRPAMATGSDLTRSSLLALVNTLHALYGDKTFTANTLARLANLPEGHPEAHPALAEALHALAENRDGQVTGKTVGRALLRHRRRILGKFLIDKDGNKEDRNGALWRLIPATTEGVQEWQDIA